MDEEKHLMSPKHNETDLDWIESSRASHVDSHEIEDPNANSFSARQAKIAQDWLDDYAFALDNLGGKC